MQIVVNISKEQYKKLKSVVDMGTGAEIIKAVRNGTVLPEGSQYEIDDAPAILETDKEANDD